MIKTFPRPESIALTHFNSIPLEKMKIILKLLKENHLKLLKLLWISKDLKNTDSKKIKIFLQHNKSKIIFKILLFYLQLIILFSLKLTIISLFTNKHKQI